MGGLRSLEYRGYDSAGIAVVERGTLAVRRCSGKLKNLEDLLAKEPLTGEFGLGHTRWATHGRPTEENAHPHRDCNGRLVVAHNGIIENYLQLKRRLVEEGHRFTTETDTEVIAHLIEKHFRGQLESAVLQALAELRGVFAFIAMTVSATGAFFWPPQTFGQLLGDVFTVAGVVFALMILLAVLSAIRNPPPGE